MKQSPLQVSGGLLSYEALSYAASRQRLSSISESRSEVVYLLERFPRLFLAQRRETVVRPKHGRRNPPPTIVEEREEGIVLIAYGEPHDLCPAVGCSGTLLFLHR
jgi:hypothetical protein